LDNLDKKKTDIRQVNTNEVRTDSGDIGDIFEGIVKLKFNYWLFVVAWPYEWLLHKKNINLPEWISWKDYYNIWDKVRVKLIELKEIDWQKKAVWESI
jgi:ribosomal protein S1